MTPAERDEVRRIAQESTALGGADVNECDVNALARAALRYVPPGDVTGLDALITARVVETVGGLPVIELGPKIGFVAPDSARRIAYALHAAADAAEENRS